MNTFRRKPPTKFAETMIVKVKDYSLGDLNGLPKANVIKFILADDSWISIRPSGTEPKCKFYIGVKKESAEASEEMIEMLEKALIELIK